MTAEQLQHAREAAWRQDGNALLTADDAAAWLRETGLAPFLPRTAQIAAPAPSFVEATTGAADATPKPSAVENAVGLLHRLLASRDAVALNLLGTPGDQPDFLATEETLPFIFALRGDREWTRGPRGKSSPLVVEIWKLLDREGALTADEVKDRMGRHLTESAALRALTDLWTGLRVEPLYSKTEGTHWQLLEGNHEKAMIAGSTMAQGMALSALVSLYLQSAIAATEDEIEAFLSPLASRSRIRDAVRGLTATRQLGIRNLGPHEHFFVEGGLPEFPEHSGNSTKTEFGAESASKSAIPDLLPEVPVPADIVVKGAEGAFRIEELSESENEKERSIGEGRKRFVAQRTGQTGDRKDFGKRSGGERKTFGGGPRKGGPREGASRESGEKRPFFAREPWKEDKRPVRPAAEGSAPGAPSGERRPFRKEGDRKPFAPRPAGEGEARSFRKPFTPREGARPFSGGGDRKPFTPREGARPFSGGGDRKPFTPREGARPFSGGGDRKPFTPREGARPFSGGGDRKPFTPREGAAGRPFRRDANEGGGSPPRRTGSTGAAPQRFSSEDGRPPRPEAPAGQNRPGSKRPRTAPFTSSGKPRTGVGKTGRPGPRSARPGASPRKAGGKGPKRNGS